MTTLDPKPKKIKVLNTKILPIAATLLLVLALLFMATPLLRGSAGFYPSGANGQINRQFNGQQFIPGTGNGTTLPGAPNSFQGQGGNTQGGTFPGQGNSTTGRKFINRSGFGVLGIGFLSGITGTIVYATLLLVSLGAALGMFLAKRWGQVLGIIMAIIYLVLGLLNFLSMLLLGFLRGFNALSLGLSITHLVLAIAVIVLAVLPARKVIASVIPTTLSTPVTPPAGSA